MRLSTRGRYGVRALLDVALQPDRNPVMVKDIARRQGIPVQYLQQLVSALGKAGLLRSIRGARGGVTLTRPPDQIKLSEIVQALERSTAPVKCLDDPGVCSRSDFCATRDVWGQIDKAVSEILDSTTVQDLVNKCNERKRGRAAPAPYKRSGTRQHEALTVPSEPH